MILNFTFYFLKGWLYAGLFDSRYFFLTFNLIIIKAAIDSIPGSAAAFFILYLFIAVSFSH